MGRNQAFDDVTVVQAARDVFWDKGFDATTIGDLELATSLNRSSIYHAFGSKRGLFDAAVDDYLRTVIRPRLVPLHGRDGGAGLRTYFEDLRTAVTSLADSSTRHGCLLVNCASGLAGHDEPARIVVDAYRAELTAAIRQALARLGDRTAPAAPQPDDPRLPYSAGQHDDAGQLDTRARLLASLSISAMVLARINRDEAVAMLTSALDQIHQWGGRADATRDVPGVNR